METNSFHFSFFENMCDSNLTGRSQPAAEVAEAAEGAGLSNSSYI